MIVTQGLIDFHHHARPAAFFDALAESGRITMGGRPFPPAWTAAQALGFMDRLGIAAAVVSAPDADLLYRDRAFALRLSRLLNELFADAIHARPQRFGAFASLPMPHIDDTLKELAYSFDELRLDGVMLSTSYDGRYLGNADFDPVFDELNRRRGLVFVHPVTPKGINEFGLDFPASLLEYAFDTTRCIASLLHHRVPDRFPDIQFIFSHAGGAMPYLLNRMCLMEYFMTAGHILSVEADSNTIQRGLRSFHYDIALSAIDPVFQLLRQVVGLDRLLFGSDYPQVPEQYARAAAQAVNSSKILTDVERGQVGRTNGVALVPRLAQLST